MRIAFDGTALRPGRTGVGYYTEHLLHHLAQVASNDELIVVSNRADRHDVAAAAAGADRDAVAPRAAHGLDADARGDRAARSGGRRRAFHQRHGAADVAGADRRDDPRHEPAAVSALSPGAPRAAEPAAGRSRGAPRRRHHHRVGERQARHRPLLPPRSDAACTSSTKRRRRRSSAVRRSGRARARAPALRPRRAHHPLRRHDRAAQEPADADRRVCRAAPQRRADASARVRRPVRLAVARSRGPHRALARRARDQLHRLRAVRGSARRSTASRRCSCIPSMYEGFGLPVIEAMACGAPVVTGRAAGVGGGRRRRHRARRRDRAGRARAARWSRWPRAATGARSLSATGLARSATFSWERAARESLEIYRQTRRMAARRAAAPRPVEATRPRDGARRLDRTVPRRRRPTCSSARRTSCASIRSCGRRASRTRRSARCTRRPSSAQPGYRVALFDAMLAASEHEWAAALDAHRPRFAVIYEDNFNYLSKMCLLRMRAGGA